MARRAKKSVVMAMVAAGMIVISGAILVYQQPLLKRWHVWRFENADPLQKEEIVETLIQFGAVDVVERWYISRLESTDDSNEAQAVNKLSELGSLEAIPHYLRIIGTDPIALSAENDPTFSAYEALDKLGDKAFPALVAGLKNPEAEVRMAALGELSRRDRDGKAIRPIVESLKSDSEESLLWASRFAFDPTVLSSAVRAPYPSATWGLTERRHFILDALNYLIRLGSKHPDRIIEELPRATKPLLPVLQKVVGVVASRSGSSFYPRAIEMFESRDPNIRYGAVIATYFISFINFSGAEMDGFEESMDPQLLVPALKEARADEDPFVRQLADLMLARMQILIQKKPDPELAPVFERSLDHEDTFIRQIAATHYIFCKGKNVKAALPGLLEAMASHDHDDELLELFRTIGGAAFPGLIELLEIDDESVRHSAMIALAIIIGAEAKPAISALRKRLEDLSERVRKIAAEALKHIQKD